MEYHSLAHNQVLGYDPAVELATDFLLSGQITDTCSGSATSKGLGSLGLNSLFPATRCPVVDAPSCLLAQISRFHQFFQ